MAAPVKDSSDDLDLNHEINVTPFIDVILVLLIIFMVAAPLATSDIPVQLPTSQSLNQPPPEQPIYLTLQQDHSLYVGDTLTSVTMVAPQLNQMTGGDFETKIFIRADKQVDYGALMEVLNLLRQAGYLKIGLVGLEAVPPLGDNSTPFDANTSPL